MDSLLWAALIQWLAYYKFGVRVNSTQLQKLMFICYGVVLAKYEIKLFADDTPKAWPFGPVFPRSYKRFKAVRPLSNEEKGLLSQNPEILQQVVELVRDYCHHSATRLSQWSHRPDGPWDETVKINPGWNREIPDQLIHDYFKGDWKTGL